MMILKHIFVIVSESFSMFHCNQKWIIYTSTLKPLISLNTYGCATSQHRQAKNPAIMLRSEKCCISSPVLVK
jgi:hypothetical protein